MASPPFDLDVNSPGDTDLARIFPANERGFRDKVASWFRVQGNTNGGTNQLYWTPLGSDPTPGAGVIAMWVNATGHFFRNFSTGGKAEIGNPSGTVLCFAGATLPGGYLWCNGVSYATSDYPDLSAAIRAVTGGADGSHFYVPDLRERLPLGAGTMGGAGDPSTITSAVSGFDPTVLNTTGGTQSITLDATMIPAHTHTFTGDALATHHHSLPWVASTATITAGASGLIQPSSSTNTSDVSAGTPTGTNASTGGGLAHRNIPPVLVLNYIIKT